MGRTAKVSISLPEEVLRAVEQRREVSRETRSDFFRRAAEALLRHEQEREAIVRYVRGYEEHPETDEERAWGGLGSARLAEASW